jgi:hypothetical protein
MCGAVEGQDPLDVKCIAVIPILHGDRQVDLRVLVATNLHSNLFGLKSLAHQMHPEEAESAVNTYWSFQQSDKGVTATGQLRIGGVDFTLLEWRGSTEVFCQAVRSGASLTLGVRDKVRAEADHFTSGLLDGLVGVVEEQKAPEDGSAGTDGVAQVEHTVRVKKAWSRLVEQPMWQKRTYLCDSEPFTRMLTAPSAEQIPMDTIHALTAELHAAEVDIEQNRFRLSRGPQLWLARPSPCKATWGEWDEYQEAMDTMALIVWDLRARLEVVPEAERADVTAKLDREWGILRALACCAPGEALRRRWGVEKIARETATALEDAAEAWAPQNPGELAAMMEEAMMVASTEVQGPELVEEEPAPCVYEVHPEVPAAVRKAMDGVVERLERVTERVTAGDGIKDRGRFNFRIDTGGQTFVDRPRRFNEVQKRHAEAFMEENLAADRIELVADTSEAGICVSNLLMVKKPDGNMRVCMDARGVNKVTTTDRTYVPCVRDVMDQVSPQARCFIMMDIRWGFHHIPVEEESRKCTCFYGPDGRLYRWKVMTFGWKNAPAFFHHWMAHLTHNLAGVYFYVDDICVEGGTWEETLANLEVLVKRLEELRVSVAIKKLQIGPQVKMLGWVRDAAGFHPRADRMEALQRCASPANKGELRSVLGALRFLSPGVPDLNRTIARLNRLTGNVPWEWLPEDEAALRKGMQLLAHHVAQAPVRWDLPFLIRWDASEDGIGGYLLQQVPVGAAVEEHVIMCWSRGYGNGPMSRWATVEKEAYALIYAVDQCAKYVAGAHFVIETDHRPLLWMLQGVAKQNTGGKIFRWFYLLSSFDFEIRHIAGTTNVLADALSRSPVVPARGGVERERNDGEREPRVNVTQQIKTKVSDDKGKEEADEQPQAGEVEVTEPIWGQEPQTPQSEFQEDAFQTVVVHLKQAGGVPKRFQSEQYEEVVGEALEWQSELQLVNGRLKYGSAFYIPKLQRPQLLFNAHSAPTGGHFGVRPTTLKLDGRAWWPGWKQDVETWCRTCGSCQRN